MNEHRAWWFFASLVVFQLAVGIVRSMDWPQIDGPQPERLHGEVRAIASDYGFTEIRDSSRLTALGAADSDSVVYEATGLDESDIENIAKRLDSVCKDWTSMMIIRGAKCWTTPRSNRLRVTVIVIDSPADGAVLIYVTWSRRDRITAWDRFRSRWPS